ncbi:hypothetical protein CVD19_16950 [Bacillus sp. T33-2]|nr:hypothetical protein CVD19_16950 [Bacillus sp. T33-2]
MNLELQLRSRLHLHLEFQLRPRFHLHLELQLRLRLHLGLHLGLGLDLGLDPGLGLILDPVRHQHGRVLLLWNRIQIRIRHQYRCQRRNFHCFRFPHG